MWFFFLYVHYTTICVIRRPIVYTYVLHFIVLIELFLFLVFYFFFCSLSLSVSLSFLTVGCFFTFLFFDRLKWGGGGWMWALHTSVHANKLEGLPVLLLIDFFFVRNTAQGLASVPPPKLHEQNKKENRKEGSCK